MRRVVVTGAGGFVGRAVVPRLLAEGWTVRAALRSPDGVSALPAGTEAVALGPDSRDTAAVLQGAEAVVHLAALAHVPARGKEFLATCRQVNGLWPGRLAEAAAEAGVRRFVFMSTVKVLGEASLAPLLDEDVPAPSDPYAESKLEAEERLRDVAARTGLEVAILRPPLVYGPGVRANFLRLLGAVRRGLPLPLGAVRNRRSLVFTDNLASAVAACVLHPRAVGETFLVSDGRALSTPELVRRLAEAMGRPARLVPVPEGLLRLAAVLAGHEAAYRRLCGSLEVDGGRIRRLLGWEPPVPMDEGLRRTVAWFLART